MNVRFDLSHSTLTTAQQTVVDGINKFLAWLPDTEDATAARRLAMMILEAADVAPQQALAEAAGLTQDRSVRVYKDRLQSEGLAGLFDRPIPGRPAIATQTPVEKALIQVVLAAVIEEHAVPNDGTLAERVNQVLRADKASAAGGVTASMVETLRLRWGIQRVPLQQALDTASTQTAEPGPVQLVGTDASRRSVRLGDSVGRDRLAQTSQPVAHGTGLCRDRNPVVAYGHFLRRLRHPARVSSG